RGDHGLRERPGYGEQQARADRFAVALEDLDRHAVQRGSGGAVGRVGGREQDRDEHAVGPAFLQAQLERDMYGHRRSRSYTNGISSTTDPGGGKMLLRPVTVDDAAWIPRLAERLFAPWESDYGTAVARWMGQENTSGWVAVDEELGPVG